MNKIILIFLLTIVMFTGCKEDEIDLFGEDHFIHFNWNAPYNSQDYYIKNVSFALMSEETIEYTVKIPIRFMGKYLNNDINFGVTVVDTSTLPTDCYELDLVQNFKADEDNTDTLYLKLFKKPVLEEGNKFISIRLKETEECKLCMQDSCFAVINVSNKLMKPEWWDDVVNESYLGEYSDLKYLAFVEETGCYNFGKVGSSYKRHYAIMFKRALEANPRYEENGALMTVTITG